MTRGSPREEFGPYLVYEQLGAGGMAEVHRAEQSGIEGFRKTVALKRMLPHVAGNAEMVRSFVREARLASYLRHANVAQTYELGMVGDIYFIAMELIEGRSLRDILRRCGQLDQLIPVPLALNILNQICDALDYAHNLRDHGGVPLGIIHRDVSPSNVIVANDGMVKLIDFGIAKASAAGMQTLGGTIKGKYGYMAPEYLNGKLDARADLFAVGVIAHELLTNRPLFTTRDDIDTLKRLRDMPIQPPSRRNRSVPPEIDDIVMTALERDPDSRWQHATALRTALTTLTQRLGMQVTNQEVVAWLDAVDLHAGALPYADNADAVTRTGDSVVISIEQPHTAQLAGEPILPPVQTPAGTPHSRRHEELVPSESFLSVEVVPTRVGPPAPRPPTRTLVGMSSASIVALPAPAPAPEQTSESRAQAAAKPAAGSSTHLRAVLLVLLVAAVAATAIYFLT